MERLINGRLPLHADHMSPESTSPRPSFDDLLDDRDYLFRLLDTIDWDAQLDAIRSVLARNRSAAERVATNITELGEQARTYSGPYHHRLVDQHVDAMFSSSYSDAAVSLSAIGPQIALREPLDWSGVA
jgi:hypothetical protein